MEQETWDKIQGDLSRLSDNNARVFTDDDLSTLGKIVKNTSVSSAANMASIFLKNSHLDGELLQIFGERIGNLIGQPLDIHPNRYLPIQELSAWVTNPESQTAERW